MATNNGLCGGTGGNLHPVWYTNGRQCEQTGLPVLAIMHYSWTENTFSFRKKCTRNFAEWYMVKINEE